MNLVESCSVFVCADEGDGKTLGTESASTTNSMEVRVCVKRHVKVEHDVDLFNVDTTAKELSGYEDAVSKLLETLVDLKSKVQNAVIPPTLIQILKPT